MKIAVGLPQIGTDPGAVLEAAAQAEAAGAWGVWVFDNLAPLVGPHRPCLEGWSLLGPLAGATNSLRLVSLVTRAGLRTPALTARMAAVVQAAAGGRFVLGLGAGDPAAYAEEARFGVDAPADRSWRIEALHETIDRVRDDPMPVRPAGPAPPVWVGGRASDLVDIAATRANAWHGWGLSVADFAERVRRVRDRAGTAVECWWGDVFRDSQATALMDELEEAGADGITWMIAAAREEQDRPRLLQLCSR